MIKGVDGIKTTMINCTINRSVTHTEDIGCIQGIIPYRASTFVSSFHISLNNDVLNFISKIHWRVWTPGTARCGTTWLELLAKFDLTGYR